MNPPDQPTKDHLTLTEGACLSLVVAGATHGYDIAKRFHPSGDIGEVFTLSNPVVYRTLKTLEERSLIVSTEALGVRGQLKWMLACTSQGVMQAELWLETPVAHVREIRNEFLVKLMLRTQAGLPNKNFIKAQRIAINKVITRLQADRASEPVAMWRREQARAVARFLDELSGNDSALKAENDFGDAIQLSARNQIRAVVESVKHGDVLSSVKLRVEDNQMMTATITREATDELSLATGTPILAVCKATDVLVARR